MSPEILKIVIPTVIVLVVALIAGFYIIRFIDADRYPDLSLEDQVTGYGHNSISSNQRSAISAKSMKLTDFSY